MSALGEHFWPQLLKGKPVGWFGDVDARHSLTYVPDFAQSLSALGADEGAWGRAWHVTSPEALTVREVAQRVANLSKLREPEMRRTPRWLLQGVGLAIPAARELLELEYSFENDCVMLQEDWNSHLDARAWNWEAALMATVADWRTDSINW